MKNKRKSEGSAASSKPTEEVEDKIWQDPRFTHLVSDPRFKSIHKSTRKVKIDKRFESMFKDDKFKVKYTIDKYGRPANKSSSEDLKKYYDLSSEDEAEEQRKEAEEIVKEDVEDTANLNDNLDINEEIPTTLKEKLQDLSVDYARGEGKLLSDSSSDDETSDEEGNDELFIEHVWGELDVDAPKTEDSTYRLAVCNMDWDRMRAVDIMVLCNSFLPSSGSIVSVTIYPSEFGKERMAQEEIKGPQELTERKLDSDEDDSASDVEGLVAVVDENEEGTDYNMEKLRQYQLNRLKYFYAVVVCNSVSTADKIYAECDGMEYESTATKLDLRFIPDDMTFEDEPKDVCSELPDTNKYMPRLFTTTALQQAKVELTWDENDVERKELNDKLCSGKLNDVADHDLRKYVAYSSESEEDDETGKPDVDIVRSVTKKTSKKEESDEDENSEVEQEIKPKKDSLSKYKTLLAEINEKEEQKKNNRIEMEFSWGIGMTDKSKKAEETLTKDPEKTHFEKILEGKKEKKKARKEEQKKLRKKYRKGGDGVSDGSDDDLDSDDAENFPDGIDMNDPYFAEEFANGQFEAPKKLPQKSQKKGKSKRFTEPTEEQKQRESELALLLDDGGDDDGKAHFNLKKIQDTQNETKSKKRRKQLKRSRKQIEAEKSPFIDDFEVNAEDKRFSAVYSSHLFNIDPTDPNFKKTKGMDKLIEEKLKRKPESYSQSKSIENDVESPASKKPKRDVEVSMLVKSIKRKVGKQ